MNVVMLIGRLTRDPELRVTQGGKSVANFGLAVDREFSKEKATDFFNVVVWGKQAESVANYMNKGRLIAVRGSLQNRSYEDKENNKRNVTEVVAERVEFLDWGDQDKSSAPRQQSAPSGGSTQAANEEQPSGLPQGDYNFHMDDDDVPF